MKTEAVSRNVGKVFRSQSWYQGTLFSSPHTSRSILTPHQDDISEWHKVEEDGGKQEDGDSHPAEEWYTPVKQAEQEQTVQD